MPSSPTGVFPCPSTHRHPLAKFVLLAASLAEGLSLDIASRAWFIVFYCASFVLSDTEGLGDWSAYCTDEEVIARVTGISKTR